MTLKCRAKFEEKPICGLENDMLNLANFIKTLESVIIGIFMRSFCPKQKIHELQLTEELQVMTLKNDEKSEEELTCRFKIEIKNLTNVDSRTWKSQEFTL